MEWSVTMETKEAMDIIGKILKNYAKYIMPRQKQALHKAFVVLERDLETPVKMKSIFPFGVHEICPNCDNILRYKKDMFCSKCGQKLDWDMTK